MRVFTSEVKFSTCVSPRTRPVATLSDWLTHFSRSEPLPHAPSSPAAQTPDHSTRGAAARSPGWLARRSAGSIKIERFDHLGTALVRPGDQASAAAVPGRVEDVVELVRAQGSRCMHLHVRTSRFGFVMPLVANVVPGLLT